MTKLEIATNLHDKFGFSKRESARIVDMFFEIIKKNLAAGENVNISGFGNFVIKQKGARKGRNPQTGEEIEVTARKVLLFRLSQVLKDEINQRWENR